nr:transmembrane protein 33 homolog [Tanacetum cinerariifolium]
MNIFKIGTSRRKSLDKENVSKQMRNFKTRPMFEEGDIDDDFDDINDMVDEAMENIEGDTVNAGSAVNTTTTGVIAASASVTTAGISISTTEPRIPPTTTTTAFDDEDFTIAQTLIKMRNEKAKEKGSAKQIIFATSSAEAEYIAAFDAFKKAIWLEKVHTDDNLADPFTKALGFPKHSEHNKNIGILPASSLMKYLEELCVWVESNTTTLSILSSQAEIRIGFLLIVSLLSFNKEVKELHDDAAEAPEQNKHIDEEAGTASSVKLNTLQSIDEEAGMAAPQS